MPTYVHVHVSGGSIPNLTNVLKSRPFDGPFQESLGPAHVTNLADEEGRQ